MKDQSFLSANRFVAGSFNWIFFLMYSQLIVDEVKIFQSKELKIRHAINFLSSITKNYAIKSTKMQCTYNSCNAAISNKLNIACNQWMPSEWIRMIQWQIRLPFFQTLLHFCITNIEMLIHCLLTFNIYFWAYICFNFWSFYPKLVYYDLLKMNAVHILLGWN